MIPNGRTMSRKNGDGPADVLYVATKRERERDDRSALTWTIKRFYIFIALNMEIRDEIKIKNIWQVYYKKWTCISDSANKRKVPSLCLAELIGPNKLI